MTLYPIAGKSGPGKWVAIYHTNKHLHNFHWNIEDEVNMLYESDVEAGYYLKKTGLQNGYDEVGYTLIEIKTYAPVV